MSLSKAAVGILTQLSELINQIQDDDYATPSRILNGSTVGQHIRHILEFFMCFEAGFHEGVINYDKRNHDTEMERDRVKALAVIEDSLNFISTLPENRSLKMEVGYDLESDATISVDTNTIRELVYNIEHAVHHMAILKIGIKDVTPYVDLDRNFGVAVSTIRFDTAGSRISDHH